MSSHSTGFKWTMNAKILCRFRTHQVHKKDVNWEYKIRLSNTSSPHFVAHIDPAMPCIFGIIVLKWIKLAHKYVVEKWSWSLLTDFTDTNLVLLLFHHCSLLADIDTIQELPDVLLSHSGGLLDQSSWWRKPKRGGKKKKEKNLLRQTNLNNSRWCTQELPCAIRAVQKSDM